MIISTRNTTNCQETESIGKMMLLGLSMYHVYLCIASVAFSCAAMHVEVYLDSIPRSFSNIRERCVDCASYSQAQMDSFINVSIV